MWTYSRSEEAAECVPFLSGGCQSQNSFVSEESCWDSCDADDVTKKKRELFTTSLTSNKTYSSKWFRNFKVYRHILTCDISFFIFSFFSVIYVYIMVD